MKRYKSLIHNQIIMARQSAMQSVFMNGPGVDVLYARGRNVVDVLRGAAEIIRKYYPEATVKPLYNKAGTEPKLVIQSPGRRLQRVSIRNMKIGDLCTLLGKPGVANIEFEYVKLHDIRYYGYNPISIEHSEPDGFPKKLRVAFMVAKIGFMDIEKLMKPYIGMAIWPSSDENVDRLVELEGKLEKV